MPLIRAIASVVVIGLAVAAFLTFVYTPYECSVVEHEVSLRSDRAMMHGDPLFRAPLARHNLESLAPFRDRYPTVNLLMLDGWNRRMVDDLPGAEQSYQRAIALGARAETFVELGLTQLDAGKTDAAFQSLLAGGAFDKSFILELPYSSLKEELLTTLQERDGYEQVLRRWKKDCVQ